MNSASGSRNGREKNVNNEDMEKEHGGKTMKHRERRNSSEEKKDSTAEETLKLQASECAGI